ncbi:MAG: DMT family transporter [Chloroflexi bacterium]|nr:DMT family transporter [Chloroflexota bacterium]
MKIQHLLAYLALSLIWGLSFLVVVNVVQAFGWVGAVTFRALVAGGVLFAISLASGRKLNFSGGWQPFALVGATTVAGQLVGLSVAAPRIGTTMTAVFVAAIPLFSMLIGQMWGIEKISRSGVAGLLLGLIGIVLLVGFPTIAINNDFIVGCVVSVFGAICAAFGSNYASRYLRQVGSHEVTIGSFLWGGLMTLPLLWLVPVPTTPRLIDFGYLLLLGSTMSALAYVIYFRLVSTIGATKTISVEFVVTVVAVLVGTLLLGERLSLAQTLGTLSIIAGCALVLGLVGRPSSG